MPPATTTPAAPVAPNDKKKIADAAVLSGQDLMAPDNVPIPVEDQERHRLYLLLLMRLVRLFWNGNRRGPTGDYPYRTRQLDTKLGVYDGGRPYMGHNIAAIAVDGSGKVVDFDFNHNEVFRSSIEHAEARLMRRMFSLTGLRSNWELGTQAGAWPDINYSTMLRDVTVYTSLEPCSQCIGIMSQARIKELIYLEPDDGAMRICNVLYRLKPYGTGIRPIEGNRIERFPYSGALRHAHEEFMKKVVDPGQSPFWKDGSGKEDRSASLASFLCTDAALEQYDQATYEFDQLTPQKLLYPSYPPKTSSGPPETRITNSEVLDDVNEFLKYAQAFGNRGTPH